MNAKSKSTIGTVLKIVSENAAIIIKNKMLLIKKQQPTKYLYLLNTLEKLILSL